MKSVKNKNKIYKCLHCNWKGYTPLKFEEEYYETPYGCMGGGYIIEACWVRRCRNTKTYCNKIIEYREVTDNENND